MIAAQVPVAVDTNVLFSALLRGGGHFTETLLRSEHPFYVCESVLVELFKRKEKILCLSRLDEDDLLRAYHVLLRRLHLYREDLIEPEHWRRAHELCRDVDETDTPPLALGPPWHVSRIQHTFLLCRFVPNPRCHMSDVRPIALPDGSVVHSDPEIVSGTPVFVGTRVPVQTLVDYLEGGYSLDEFLDNFPSVCREQVHIFLEQATQALLSRVTIETTESGEPQPVSFLHTARALNLQGPTDWSARLEDYLYGDSEAQG